ncbi:MAG: nucleotidyltransferase family protein [Candidatus Latescibacteria bacterium]|nr:nucleotidyltransferase family protein [Candidatus Latescibacterota bacterium]
MSEEQPQEAVILVGGRGSRLRSVVDDRPKPMAPVLGKPFLEWLILYLKSQGMARIVLATGYRGEMVHEYFGDGDPWDIEISYSQENEPLGTGGALRLALEKTTTEQVIVLNGDSFCSFDLQKLSHVFMVNHADAVMLLVEMNDCDRFGSVEIDEDGRIMGFCEKSTRTGRGLINAGIYLLSRSCVESLPKGKYLSLEQNVFPDLVHKRFYSLTEGGPFIDIGTPESYAMAAEFLDLLALPKSIGGMNV